jgi:aldehyde:ferredoxin oxidoreductase
MKGYTGKILHVDLGTGAMTVEEPGEAFYRKYIGGSAMGAYYLLDGMAAGVDPLGPDNLLVFTLGPITGAAISGASRHCVSTKSPLTGTIMSSEAGGYWAPELRFAGFDGIVIRGKAKAPVYLWIHDGAFELKPAASVWGKFTLDAQEGIRSELGEPKARVALIGPAGEKLVRFAAIANDLRHFNGRGGVGAVMGSKNLKAIAVRGTLKPDWQDPEYLKDLAKAGAAKVQAEGFYNVFRNLGTTMNVDWNSGIGGLPTKNWTMGTWDKNEEIRAETYREKMMDNYGGTCWACAQSCKRDVKAGISEPWAIEERYGGPEYETVGMCGSNCLVSDLRAIAKVNEICAKYCMDTISAGGVAGFVMECFEKGLLTAKDTGGLEARFGDGDSLVRLVEAMGSRKGFGDDMAEGTHRLAKKLGGAALGLDVTVKGKEFPAHMPQSKRTMALMYAVNPFGPDHVSSSMDGEFAGEIGEVDKQIGVYDTVDFKDLGFAKARATAYTQRAVSAIDTFSVCNFCFNTWSIYGFDELVACVNAATGWRYTVAEMMIVGERRLNMLKVFNEREGFGVEDDNLPARIFDEPLVDAGLGKGQKVDRKAFLEARAAYYSINGWDPVTGVTTGTKLRDLGIDWAKSDNAGKVSAR